MIKNWKYLKADGLISRKATTLSSCNLRFGKLERKEETETTKLKDKHTKTNRVENGIGVGFGGYVTENTRPCRCNHSRHCP